MLENFRILLYELCSAAKFDPVHPTMLKTVFVLVAVTILGGTTANAAEDADQKVADHEQFIPFGP